MERKGKKEVDEEGENKSLEEKQFLMVSEAQAPQPLSNMGDYNPEMRRSPLCVENSRFNTI